VANLLDDHQDPVANKAYLVLERAGDLTLERLVQNTPQGLSLDQVKLIARQLSEAVAFLHENKIAHRDIKPDNIMLTEPELALKLIDFNIAHDLSVCPEIKGANGVRAWSAPETRKFQSYDERCDLWSVGCVLYYACTGSAPFHEEASLELSDALIA
jgi:serine/threonine protein kinase